MIENLGERAYSTPFSEKVRERRLDFQTVELKQRLPCCVCGYSTSRWNTIIQKPIHRHCVPEYQKDTAE